MNYISLFSSAGIGCFGFKQENFDCVATSELINRRLQVQKANNKVKYENGYILGDISKKSKKEELYEAISFYKKKENIKDIDVIVFTAPCQGMSVANHKKNDGTLEKNSLVVEALEIIEKIKPIFFVAENVRSFMNTKCIDHNENKKIGDAFSDWLSSEYFYKEFVINFKDYGANSSRTRTLVIGTRKDKHDISIINEILPNKETPKTLREVIGHLPKLSNMGQISDDDIYHNFKPYKEHMRQWIENLKEGESAFNNKELNLRPHRIIDGEIVLNVNKNGDKYKRQVWDKVAPCVHTRNDIISSQNTVHPEDDRVFSIRELMLMMNIPRDFKWVENYNLEELNNLPQIEKKNYLKKHEINIRQSIGEAIPTIILQKIASNIKKIVKEEKVEKKFESIDEQLQFIF
ncbi:MULTISPECIES: DNA cytosine methyltransferase [unclassified Staphylococcus]|uniref:DNA cytosine methyltransferase n=1 Tax=Staphylococcus TaxID=1279 RepID=UPI00085C468D|nr:MULTISPECIES: DNA cytosine methyltransferase [unclassified Staphylococcus]SCS91045.1 DNA-cytosine methyltransferase [Staphylococcus cohnii subsp. cohnii]